MVPLSLMVRLVEAVRDDAQLVLVGDPDQLAAIEVGAVLRDIVGPAAEAPQFGAGMRATLARVTGAAARLARKQRSFGDGVAVLRRGHRSVAPIGALAEAIRRGDGDAAVAALDGRLDDSITWLRDPTGDMAAAAARTRSRPTAPLIAAARAGDADRRRCGSSGLSAAVRPPPRTARRRATGPRSWSRGCARRSPASSRARSAMPGLPLLVTRNDYELRLHNGDTGVVVRGRGRRAARGVRRRRRDDRARPVAAGGRRAAVRDDRPQEPGLRVRRRGAAAARAGLAAALARAALHRVSRARATR